jgi:hypothetical protein
MISPIEQTRRQVAWLAGQQPPTAAGEALKPIKLICRPIRPESLSGLSWLEIPIQQQPADEHDTAWAAQTPERQTLAVLWSERRSPAVAQIRHLSVDPAWPTQAVGQPLIQYVCGRIHRRGVLKLLVGPGIDREVARTPLQRARFHESVLCSKGGTACYYADLYREPALLSDSYCLNPPCREVEG